MDHMDQGHDPCDPFAPNPLIFLCFEWITGMIHCLIATAAQLASAHVKTALRSGVPGERVMSLRRRQIQGPEIAGFSREQRRIDRSWDLQVGKDHAEKPRDPFGREANGSWNGSGHERNDPFGPKPLETLVFEWIREWITVWITWYLALRREWINGSSIYR